jgi:hypothetical protein
MINICTDPRFALAASTTTRASISSIRIARYIEKTTRPNPSLSNFRPPIPRSLQPLGSRGPEQAPAHTASILARVPPDPEDRTPYPEGAMLQVRPIPLPECMPRAYLSRGRPRPCCFHPRRRRRRRRRWERTSTHISRPLLGQGAGGRDERLRKRHQER